MESIKTQPKTYLQSREFGFRSDPVTVPMPSQPIPQHDTGGAVIRLSNAEFMARVARPYCAACHSGAKAKALAPARNFLLSTSPSPPYLAPL